MFKIPETSPNCALSQKDRRRRQDGMDKAWLGRCHKLLPHPKGMLTLLTPARKPVARWGCQGGTKSPLPRSPAHSPFSESRTGNGSLEHFPSQELVTNFPIPLKSVGGGGGISQLSNVRGEKKHRRWNFQGKWGLRVVANLLFPCFAETFWGEEEKK